MTDRINQVGLGTLGTATVAKPVTSQGENGTFAAMLSKEMGKSEGQQVAFSKHAMERAQERGIEVTPNLMDRLNDSVEKAQSKGATNILAFDRSLAFIINVPNQRVITTMSQDEMKENIFTNIDGAVML